MSRWKSKRLSIVEAVSESKCLMKELQRRSGPQPEIGSKFRCIWSMVMIDSLLAEMKKKRMKAYDDISKIFRFLSESELSLSNEKIEEKAKNIVLLVSG